jgi:hypothetical protein
VGGSMGDKVVTTFVRRKATTRGRTIAAREG